MIHYAVYQNILLLFSAICSVGNPPLHICQDLPKDRLTLPGSVQISGHSAASAADLLTLSPSQTGGSFA